MPVETLDIAEPFFTLRLIKYEACHIIDGRAIVLNLAETPVRIRDQNLAPLTSVIVQDCTLDAVQHIAVIERFDALADEAAFMEQVRATWPSAYDVRQEDRLRTT